VWLSGRIRPNDIKDRDLLAMSYWQRRRPRIIFVRRLFCFQVKIRTEENVFAGATGTRSSAGSPLSRASRTKKTYRCSDCGHHGPTNELVLFMRQNKQCESLTSEMITGTCNRFPPRVALYLNSESKWHTILPTQHDWDWRWPMFKEHLCLSWYSFKDSFPFIF
jgi:hypothetical protein